MRGEKLGLQGWTYKDEFELRRLEKKHSDLEFVEAVKRGRTKISSDKDGRLTYEETIQLGDTITPSNRLVELRAKKKEIERDLSRT